MNAKRKNTQISMEMAANGVSQKESLNDCQESYEQKDLTEKDCQDRVGRKYGFDNSLKI